jgi:hypothetical protein
VSSGFLQRRWDDLRAQAARLPAEHLELLAGLNTEAALLGLAPIPQLPDDYHTAPRLFLESPSFRNFSPELALPLKAGLWSDEFRPQSLAWAEKLLRFCEVRLAELPARVREKWPSRTARQQGLLELAVLFLETHRALGDARYVNTALKLLEVAAVRTGPREAGGTLLSVRATLQTEAALRCLEAAK